MDKFIQEHCVIEPTGLLPISDLHRLTGSTRSATNAYMVNTGYVKGRPYIEGQQVRCWLGIRLRNPWESK